MFRSTSTARTPTRTPERSRHRSARRTPQVILFASRRPGRKQTSGTYLLHDARLSFTERDVTLALLLDVLDHDLPPAFFRIVVVVVVRWSSAGRSSAPQVRNALPFLGSPCICSIIFVVGRGTFGRVELDHRRHRRPAGSSSSSQWTSSSNIDAAEHAFDGRRVVV